MRPLTSNCPSPVSVALTVLQPRAPRHPWQVLKAHGRSTRAAWPRRRQRWHARGVSSPSLPSRAAAATQCSWAQPTSSAAAGSAQADARVSPDYRKSELPGTWTLYPSEAEPGKFYTKGPYLQRLGMPAGQPLYFIKQLRKGRG